MSADDEIPNDIRVAVIGNMLNHLLEEEKVYARMHKAYQKLHWNFVKVKSIVIWSMIFLIVFMKPSWCYAMEQKKENKIYRGGTCDTFVDNGKIINYYRSNIPLIPSDICSYINWALFTMILLIQMVKVRYSYSFSDKLTLFYLALCLATDVFIHIYTGVYKKANHYNALFRLAFAIIYTKKLRESIVRSLQIIWKSLTTIILFTLILWIFATIARALFYDVEGSQPEVLTEHYLFNFETMFSTMYTLFILSTLDNYPDLQLGVYHEDPILMLFYVIFSVFGGIVMLSVLTGVFYTNFKEFYNHKVEILLRDKEYQDLIKRCLKDRILNFENVQKILNEYIENKRQSIDFRRPQEEKSEEETVEVDLMKSFEISGDDDTESDSSETEKFEKKMRLKDMFNQNIFGVSGINVRDESDDDETKRNKVYNRRKKGQKLEIEEILNEDHIDEIEHFRNFWAYALVFTTIDMITMMIPMIQLEYYGKETSGNATNYYLFSEILNVLSLVDPILTRRFEGRKAFMQKLNLFKVVISISLIILSNILQFIPNPITETEIESHKILYRVWCVVSLMKMISVHDLLSFSAEYNLIISTFTQIMPLLSDLFLMQVVYMLIYSVFGVILLGGRVSTKSISNYPIKVGEKLEDFYEFLSFNDIPSAMLFLFCIIAQNDWSKISTMAMMEISDPTGIALARTYFLTFYWIGFVVVSNIIIGAILDFVGTYLSLLEEEKEKKEKSSKVKMTIFDMIAANRRNSKIKAQ